MEESDVQDNTSDEEIEQSNKRRKLTKIAILEDKRDDNLLINENIVI